MRRFFSAISMLVVMACNLIMNAPQSSQIETTIITLEPVQMTQSLSTPLTFSGVEQTDSVVGFKYNYPDGWYFFPSSTELENVEDYSVVIQSIAPSVGGGGFSEGETKIDMFVDVSAPSEWTLDSIEAYYHNNDSNDNVQEVSYERVILDTGLEALHRAGTGQNGWEFQTIHIPIKGYQVSLILIGDETYLWQVANTVRLS